MQTTTFRCEIITPMFLNGADGETPELRPPSFKGLMRFIWRGLNGHLSLSSLKKQEGEIFGDNDHRSKFSIQIEETKIEKDRYTPVPHKNYTLDCLKVGSTFDLTFIVPVESKTWDIKKCSALFELTCLLGDFGKRARRGMGSVNIVTCSDPSWFKKNTTIEHIYSLVQAFTPHYVLKNASIHNNFGGSMEYYPWIRQIEIGAPSPNILKKISDTTHRLHKGDLMVYEASLGHASKGRFASPVYVSVVKDALKPVITTLNTIPDRNSRDINLRLQEDFKNQILK